MVELCTIIYTPATKQEGPLVLPFPAQVVDKGPNITVFPEYTSEVPTILDTPATVKEEPYVEVFPREEPKSMEDMILWSVGQLFDKPYQVHHYSTNKSKTYTQQFKDITDKYDLDLDEEWNKELLPHQGRHPNAYHEWILDQMRNIDNIANGDRDIFLDLYESEIKSVIRENPDMLYSDYWKKLQREVNE